MRLILFYYRKIYAFSFLLNFGSYREERKIWIYIPYFFYISSMAFGSTNCHESIDVYLCNIWFIDCITLEFNDCSCFPLRIEITFSRLKGRSFMSWAVEETHKIRLTSKLGKISIQYPRGANKYFVLTERCQSFSVKRLFFSLHFSCFTVPAIRSLDHSTSELA